MTTEQKNQIQNYRQQYEQNCKTNASWGSAKYCSFKLLKSESPDDPNITIVATTITDISDNYEPYVKTHNLMIEPDGNAINLFDIFDASQVMSYIQQLKQFD
jgi:hypothetical protein